MHSADIKNKHNTRVLRQQPAEKCPNNALQWYLLDLWCRYASGFQGESPEVLKEPWLVSLFLVLVMNPGEIIILILSRQGSSCHNQVAGLPYLVHINVAVR